MNDYDRITKKNVVDGDLIGKEIGSCKLRGQEEQRPLLIANENTRIYKGFANSASCYQYGRCDCGVNLLSWAKNMICPNCGKKVRGT